MLWKLIGVGAVSLALAGPAVAASGGCHAVSGTFEANQVFVGCPIFCTAGALTGDLAGSYAFAAYGVSPAGEFLGHSTITLDNGAVLVSNDHTSIDFAHGTFVTTIDIAGGTRQYAHATGELVAPGHFTGAPGTAGDYSGTICLANSD